jgi:hypothetical protein
MKNRSARFEKAAFKPEKNFSYQKSLNQQKRRIFLYQKPIKVDTATDMGRRK